MDQELRDRLLLSIEGDHLALLCGAGLSMSPPTELPSAAALAAHCSERYHAVTGTQLPDEISEDLERLSDHFLAIHRFRELLRFVPWESFHRRPNDGHSAVADFACCRAFDLIATTNYDTHVEAAALELREPDFRPSLDGIEANALPDSHSPFLKLHGCCTRDVGNTVWAHSQLATNPTIRDRISSSTAWLTGRMAGKDLVILGFWSDWSYLNDVLANCLAGSEPRTVVLVDPDTGHNLQAKAPELWEWGHGGGIDFTHVQEYGHAFLNELRVAFSRQFIHRIISASRETFVALFAGQPPDLEWPGAQTAPDLYSLRRDFAGSGSSQSVRVKRPDNTMNLVGAFALALVRSGGVPNETYISLGDQRIRVINSANRLLSNMKTEFEMLLSSSHDCDVAICVGAIDDAVPGDLVRDAQPPDIVRRGWAGEWITHEAARERFGL